MVNSYIGRFAPSPSGPLHFGSLISALASFLDARSNGGKWLLRIDDLDTPRCVSGMDSYIQQTLEKLGLHWDDEIRYQSQQFDEYQAALNQLDNSGYLFHCYCPRRLTKGKPYPGTCREINIDQDRQHSVRVKITTESISLHDSIQTTVPVDLSQTTGDFIVQRADKIISYNLAVLVDDHATGVNHIVRGADLIDTTFNQLYLQKLLGLNIPTYTHHPVIADLNGKKYSKQHGAVDVLVLGQATELIFHSLTFLGQQPEQELLQLSTNELLDWAIKNWNLDNIPKLNQIELAKPM